MKVYKKEDLCLVNGLLVDNETGDVVAVDNHVVHLANELETRLQKALFLKTQPEACAGPNLSDFKRQSVNDSVRCFTCDTPLQDEQIKNSIAFMNEIDNEQVTNRMNDAMEFFAPLVMFVREDSILSVDGQTEVRRFDTPTLGNPLNWDEDIVANAVAMYHGVEVEENVVLPDGEQE